MKKRKVFTPIRSHKFGRELTIEELISLLEPELLTDYVKDESCFFRYKRAVELALKEKTWFISILDDPDEPKEYHCLEIVFNKGELNHDQAEVLASILTLMDDMEFFADGEGIVSLMLGISIYRPE